MQNNFVQKVGTDFDLEPSEPIIDGLFQQYERVLVESLVSSFALDFYSRINMEVMWILSTTYARLARIKR